MHGMKNIKIFRSVIICEIIVHLLVIVKNNNKTPKFIYSKINDDETSALKRHNLIAYVFFIHLLINYLPND